MVGWLATEARQGRKILVARTRVLGLWLLRVSVPTSAGMREQAFRRRVRRAAELLRREGIRRVLTTPDFQDWTVLSDCGLCPVDPQPLCQAQAGPLALAALARCGVPPAQAMVALRGLRVNRPFFHAAEYLCPKVRSLILTAPDGGADLGNYLRTEYGAPVLEGGGQSPQVTLQFSPLAGDACGITLRLWSEELDLAGFTMRVWPERSLPPTDPLPLLSLLWQEDQIGLDEIQIIPIDGRAI